MLTNVCQYLRNWFTRAIWLGDYKIVGGVLTYANGEALPLLEGQYYRIVGSVLNDGVHNTADMLTDEEFSGAVWSMAIPPDFLQLVEDISMWVTDNAKTINSPYQSESFGGYSYTLKSNGGTSGAEAGTWQSQFAARLSPWRKI